MQKFKINCPQCGQSFVAQEENVGNIMTCPNCTTDFEVTAPTTPSVPIVAPQTPPAKSAKARNPLLVPLIVVSVLLAVTAYYTLEYWRMRRVLASVASAFLQPKNGASPSQAIKVRKPAALPAQPKPPLELISWDYKFEKGDFSDSYRIRMLMKNTGSKGIKMVDASVVFTDLLDNELYGIRIDPDIYVAAGAQKDDSGTYRINQFMNEQARMKNMKKEDVKATLLVRKIVFSDNSVFDAQD